MIPNRHSKTIISGSKYWFSRSATWRKIKPPVRPSRRALEIYDKFLCRALRGKKSPRILVLGATPEMRDLASYYSEEVTVVDINMDMILAMTKIIKNKKAAKNEIWVKGNWVNVPLAPNYYGVILGDGIACQVTFEDAPKLWQHLNDLLKKKGAFLTRDSEMTRDTDYIKIANTVIKRIIRKKKLSYQDYSNLNFAIELSTFNPREKIMKIDKFSFYNALRNLAVPPKKIDKIYQDFIKIFPRVEKVWRVLTPEEYIKEASLFFRLANKKYEPQSVFSKILPIYYLEKKDPL